MGLSPRAGFRGATSGRYGCADDESN